MRAQFAALSLAFLAAFAFTPGPAVADEVQATPTPQPMPINGVTVDLQRQDPHDSTFQGSTHVERPPFQLHGAAHGHHVVPKPRPTPTP
jgi:hypothetical protein